VTDRVVVVTGATGGAGRAVCVRLQRDGFLVAAVGRDAERLAEVAANSRHVHDVGDLAAARALADAVRADHGRIDGVVHLVGGWRGGAEPDDWDWLEPRLLDSLRNVTLAFRDDLTAADAGRFVIIGSASAASPTWTNANYATLKAAGEGWMSALASGWRKAGTAAAVTLVVTSLGGDGTPLDTVADVIADLWDQPAAQLNGSRIPLPPPDAGEQPRAAAPVA
jgi:NAD(P)-dependent dehydrogenase (short-subunit alcohol dehydrogenase family)